jgi:hypothetical protein
MELAGEEGADELERVDEADLGGDGVQVVHVLLAEVELEAAAKPSGKHLVRGSPGLEQLRVHLERYTHGQCLALAQRRPAHVAMVRRAAQER